MAIREGATQRLSCGPGTMTYHADLSKFVNSEPCQDFTELGQVQNKWRGDFISGEKDPVNDWDEFVNTWMENGGECYTKQYNDAFKLQESVSAAIRTEVEEALKASQ